MHRKVHLTNVRHIIFRLFWSFHFEVIIGEAKGNCWPLPDPIRCYELHFSFFSWLWLLLIFSKGFIQVNILIISLVVTIFYYKQLIFLMQCKNVNKNLMTNSQNIFKIANVVSEVTWTWVRLIGEEEKEEIINCKRTFTLRFWFIGYWIQRRKSEKKKRSELTNWTLCGSSTAPFYQCTWIETVQTCMRQDNKKETIKTRCLQK